MIEREDGLERSLINYRYKTHCSPPIHKECAPYAKPQTEGVKE